MTQRTKQGKNTSKNKIDEDLDVVDSFLKKQQNGKKEISRYG